jgi:hypothetical protein
MGKSKVGMVEFIKFYKENGRAFKAYPLRDKSRVQFTLCNMELAKLDQKSDQYYKLLQIFNDGMVYHYAGKWHASLGIKSKSKSEWNKAYKYFKLALKISKNLYDNLVSGSALIDYPKPKLRECSEIKFFEQVPLVPEITPIVVLEGTSFEMGMQYCEQLYEIYGPWILERHQRTFNKDEEGELRKWQEEHDKYTPEIIEFCKGWSEKSSELGLPLSFEQVIDLWVGHKPPAKSYLNSNAGVPELPPLACTAIAAWNEATEDGKLIAAATGDHDMSYQITIAMYPSDGNALVFTPFEATGTLPTVGPNWFFGHPGMNSKGLAYVHHGGGPKFLEPINSWGYGIRRGASVFHNLRYSNSSDEAFAKEMAWPIGDVGYGDQATVGGFYADGTSGYIIESRHEPLCIRKPGLLGEQDYLFSNNSVMHQEAVRSEWMSKIQNLWQWDEDGGWRPKDPKGMTKSLKMMFEWFSGRLKLDELMSRGMMFAYWNSYNRNKFLNDKARAYFGRFNIESMKELYRCGGTMPNGGFKVAKRRYIDTGQWGEISAAHASNALVVVMKPEEGLYSLCTGPAKRGLAPMSPDQAISIYNERNTFWDFKLDSSPLKSLKYVKAIACDLINEVEETIDLKEMSRIATDLYGEINGYLEYISTFEDHVEDLSLINKKIRIYTRIHVVARQLLGL